MREGWPKAQWFTWKFEDALGSGEETTSKKMASFLCGLPYRSEFLKTIGSRNHIQYDMCGCRFLFWTPKTIPCKPSQSAVSICLRSIKIRIVEENMGI